MYTFIIEYCIDPVPNKHRIITTMISANAHGHVEGCADFQSVIDTLDKLFVKSHNVISVRHLLSTRRQEYVETLDQFVHVIYPVNQLIQVSKWLQYPNEVGLQITKSYYYNNKRYHYIPQFRIFVISVKTISSML